MINPLLLFTAQLVVIIVVQGVKAGASTIRLIILPVLAACCDLIVTQCMQYTLYTVLLGSFRRRIFVKISVAIHRDSCSR